MSLESQHFPTLPLLTLRHGHLSPIPHFAYQQMMSTATACFAAPRIAAPRPAIQTQRRKWSSVSKRRCAPLASVPRVPTSSRDGDASANVALSSGRLEKRVPSLLAKLGLQGT